MARAAGCRAIGEAEDPNGSRFDPPTPVAIELDSVGRLARRRSTASAEMIQAPRPD
jgi:hypothetical protein